MRRSGRRTGPGATLPAVPKNLVIVESPAKARTIERYLGAGLPRPRLLRPRPRPAREPRQGQVRRRRRPRLRTRVRDLATTAASRSPTSRRRPSRPTRSTSPPTSTARARRSPGTSPRRPTCPPTKTRRVTFSEITEPAIREAFAHPREIDQNLVDAQQTRRIVDRLVGYTLSPLLSRKVRGGLSAGRVQSVAVRLVVEREREIDAFTAREYWTIEALLATDGRRDVRRRARPHRRRGARRRRRGDRRDATPRRIARAPSGRHQDRRRGPRSARPAPPFTTSTLQQEASRKLGFSPKRTMSIAQRLYEGVETAGRPGRPHHLHADRLDRDRRRRDGRGARGHRRALRRRRTRCPRAASTRPSRRAPRRRTSRSGRPASGATRTRWPASLKPDELRLYRLIWQRALASQMARQGARDDDGRAGRRPLRAARHRRRKDAVRRLRRASTPRAATTTPPTRRRGRPAAGARRGRRHDRRRRHADPALHRAAAALHRGDADQGARGARHRPAVDLRGDDLDDRRPRLRARSRSGGCARSPSPRSSRTCWSSTSATSSTSSSPRGWRRSSTRSPAASATGCRCCASSTARCRTASTRSARELKRSDFTTEATDEVCSRGPPDGHPARAERPVPGLLAVPRAQGDAAAARRRAAARSEGDRRGLPRVRRGHARRQARPVRAVRRLLALPGLQVHQEGRPAAARPAAVRGRSAPRTTTAISSPRRARRTGQRLLGLLATTRSCDFTTNHEPLGGAPRRGRRPGRAQGRGGASASKCGATSDAPPDAIVPGERYAGGPPNPEALARPARARGGARAGGAARTGGRRAAPAPAGRPVHDAANAPGRAGRRRVSAVAARRPRPTRRSTRFLRSLAARDASPHTRRAYAHGRRRLPRLARRARRPTGAHRPAPTCAPTSRVLGAGPRPLVGRAAARRDPLVPSLGDARRPRAGDPWGAIATPRLPRRLPRVLEVDAGRAAARRRSTRSSTPPATTPDAAAHVRDRARPARPGARRDGVRGRAAHQRAGGRGPRARSTCAAARSACSARAARSGSGCSGGRRSSAPRRVSRGRPAGPARAPRRPRRARRRPRSS